MPISRLLILITAFGLMLWFIVLPSINEPVTRGPAIGSDETESINTEEHAPWTREERAVWREQINQRLHRR